MTIHDIRSDSETDVIVMECINGQTLNDQLQLRGPRTGQVLSYAVQIADALAAAHSVGIVHRDLKPWNIMVTANGRIQLWTSAWQSYWSP